MKRHFLYLPAGALALAVSPLFAQQADDAPASPATGSPAADAPQEPVADTDEDALESVREDLETLLAEIADRDTNIERLEAALEVALNEEAETAEAAHAEAAEEDGDEAVEEADIVEVQPAQPGVVVQRAVVVRGNAQLVLGGPGGFPGGRAFSAELSGLDELALGAVTDGVTSDSDPSSYRFDAEGPGLLTVAVRAKQGDDMTIEVYSDNGQQLARCDIDFGGNTGAEHLAVPIPEAGSYRVVVEPLGNGGPFWLGASWLAFQELEALAPADPEDATELTPGQAQNAALDNAETWFTYTAPANGLVMFNTLAHDGNLAIEAYYDGRFDQQVQYSDQNRNGRPGNERILMDLAEGQTVYFKVHGFGTEAGFAFTVRSRFIEDEFGDE